MIHGEGTMVYSNGEKYHGMWMKDRRNGLGTHHFRDTSRFEGEWVNDDMMGLGTFYYRNGSVYQGEWVDNRRHGSGKLSVFAREGGNRLTRMQTRAKAHTGQRRIQVETLPVSPRAGGTEYLGTLVP